MKFKNIDFIKDTFTDDNIVLTDTNGRPFDVLTNSDMQSMTVLGKYIFYPFHNQLLLFNIIFFSRQSSINGLWNGQTFSSCNVTGIQ